jgi:hypothetical protein
LLSPSVKLSAPLSLERVDCSIAPTYESTRKVDQTEEPIELIRLLREGVFMVSKKLGMLAFLFIGTATVAYADGGFGYDCDINSYAVPSSQPFVIELIVNPTSYSAQNQSVQVRVIRMTGEGNSYEAGYSEVGTFSVTSPYPSAPIGLYNLKSQPLNILGSTLTLNVLGVSFTSEESNNDDPELLVASQNPNDLQNSGDGACYRDSSLDNAF